MKDYEKLINILDKENDIVVFTGAGVSTHSGIPDFRGKNGLYNLHNNTEEILSNRFFNNNPLEFYKFLKEYLINKEAKHNLVHEVLSELEKRGNVRSIITQNIDGFHKSAGSKNVIELHGNMDEFYCVNCKSKYTLDDVLEYKSVPICNICGSLIRPNVVLYGEQLNQVNLHMANDLMYDAKYLIVLGSSLVVSPACNLVDKFIKYNKNYSKDNLFIINMGDTYYDEYSTKIDKDMIEVFEEVKKKILKK